MSKTNKERQQDYRTRNAAIGLKVVPMSFVSKEARKILDAHRASGITINKIIEKALNTLGMP